MKSWRKYDGDDRGGKYTGDGGLWKIRLVQMGYERTGQVELPGQFAIRGGILDIYPLTEEYPVRDRTVG